MALKKILRKIKRFFDVLIGDKSDEIYWKYKSYLGMNWRSGYLDVDTDVHPHRKILIKKLTNQSIYESILEIGCANGINLRMINEKNPNTTLEGIDINKKALSEGVCSLENKSIVNINLKYKSAKNLKSYKLNQFDCVFCDAVLMYIDPSNIENVLQEMIRISKKSVFLCEQHTNSDSFYNDKWIHNYNQILKKIPEIESIKYDAIPSNTWQGDWSKYGQIIEINKYG